MMHEVSCMHTMPVVEFPSVISCAPTHTAEHWGPDPLVYRPERFLPKDGPAAQGRHPLAHMVRAQPETGSYCKLAPIVAVMSDRTSLPTHFTPTHFTPCNLTRSLLARGRACASATNWRCRCVRAHPCRDTI